MLEFVELKTTLKMLLRKLECESFHIISVNRMHLNGSVDFAERLVPYITGNIAFIENLTCKPVTKIFLKINLRTNSMDLKNPLSHETKPFLTEL